MRWCWCSNLRRHKHVPDHPYFPCPAEPVSRAMSRVKS